MHTKEPWEWGENDAVHETASNAVVIRPAGEFPHGEWIADVGRAYDDRARANARRIVAAVNACAGFNTEHLERGIINKLRKEWREMHHEIEQLHAELEKYRGGE